ncbi:hypothetical protein PENSPDRAFT_617422 [Peniophora sp. CONT]|nr:hypothetical protein PENSPDRAFT_617422 [Peniophora sp. CONT]
MSSPVFQRYLLETYPKLRTQYPQASRRELRLRVVDEFFRLDQATLAIATTTAASAPPTGQEMESAPFTKDADPIDALLSAAPGVIVRADYSNDTAWLEFCALLRESEAEVLADEEPRDAHAEPGAEGEDGSDSSSDDEDEPMAETSTAAGSASVAPEPLTFFSVIESTSEEDRTRVVGVPNIALLRLVADADVRPAPAVPQGTKRVKPGHRLIDLNGFQEIYRGRSLWVYDTQSNVDGSVRMINLEGDIYGTATGDSWRVRASHITEMQVNMAFHGMKVDFGGMDRWDYSERKRNLDYATAAQ